MSTFIDHFNTLLRQYLFSSEEISVIEKELRKRLEGVENPSETFGNVQNLLKTICKDNNIRLVKKRKNVSKLEVIVTRISYIIFLTILIIAVANLFFDFINMFLLIILGLVTIFVLNIAHKNYYIASIFLFVAIISIVPFVNNNNNIYISILMLIFLVFAFIHIIYQMRIKSKTIDDQTYLYEFSEFDYYNGYFTQRFGESLIDLASYDQDKYYFDNSFGKMSIDLRELKEGDYDIHIVNSMGEVDIILSSNQCVECKIRTKLGDVLNKPNFVSCSDHNINIHGISNLGYINFTIL